MIYVVYLAWYDGPGVDFLMAFKDKGAAEAYKSQIEQAACRPVKLAEVNCADF